MVSCVASRHEAATAQHNSSYVKLLGFGLHPRGFIRPLAVAHSGAVVVSKEGPPGIFTTTIRSPPIVLLATYPSKHGSRSDLQLKKSLDAELYANPEFEKIS